MKSVFLARAIDAGTKRPVAGPHLAAAAGFGRKSKTAAAAARHRGAMTEALHHSIRSFACNPPNATRLNLAEHSQECPGSRASWLYRLTLNARNRNSQGQQRYLNRDK